MYVGNNNYQIHKQHREHFLQEPNICIWSYVGMIPCNILNYVYYFCLVTNELLNKNYRNEIYAIYLVTDKYSYRATIYGAIYLDCTKLYVV